MSLPERHASHASDFAEFLAAYYPSANRSQRQIAALAFSKGIDSKDGKPMRATVKTGTPAAKPVATSRRRRAKPSFESPEE